MAANHVKTASKKLVQGRLPFQVLRNSNSDPVTIDLDDDGEVNLKPSSPIETGKKKRSESFDDEQSAKKPKLDESTADENELDTTVATTDDEEMEDEKLKEDDDVVMLDEVGQTEVGEEPKTVTTPSSKVIIPRKATPKQEEKRLEAVKRREEKERIKQEKILKKEEERKEKQKLKEEKELARKREIEEKELQKKKAKEDKERRKQLEIEQKNEEKLRKEAEKKKKEEEDLLNKKKYAKEAAVFTNFFTKVDPEKVKTKDTSCVTEIISGFKPFAVKNRMRLAPILRNPLDSERRAVMDEALKNQDSSVLYLTELKNGSIQPKHSGNTWPLEELYQEDDPEVEEITGDTKLVVNEKRPRNHRAKLLQFCENRRPPYWGTWRKRSTTVRPRRPLGRYKAFDYEVDSDEEWEEEEPGESLHGSDDEKEKDDVEGEDDYEVDNELFVPHGYLSEDEAQPDEAWDVEQQKEKLKLLGEQFDNERNEKTKKLRPVVVGCIWADDELKFNTGYPKLDALFLRCMSIANDCELPIAIDCNDANLCWTDGNDATPPGSNVKRSTVFPDDAMPLLVKRVHGAVIRRRALARDFVTEWINQQQDHELLSVTCVSRKIRELAQWQVVQGRSCWVVLPELREKYGCGDLEASVMVRAGAEESITTACSPASTKITKFTKVLTEEERRNSLKPRTTQTADEPMDTAPPSKDTLLTPMVEKTIQKLNQFRPNPSPAIKKRVPILFSSPLGVAIEKNTNIAVVDLTETEQAPANDDQSTVDL